MSNKFTEEVGGVDKTFWKIDLRECKHIKVRIGTTLREHAINTDKINTENDYEFVISTILTAYASHVIESKENPKLKMTPKQISEYEKIFKQLGVTEEEKEQAIVLRKLWERPTSPDQSLANQRSIPNSPTDDRSNSPVIFSDGNLMKSNVELSQEKNENLEKDVVTLAQEKRFLVNGKIRDPDKKTPANDSQREAEKQAEARLMKQIKMLIEKTKPDINDVNKQLKEAMQNPEVSSRSIYAMLVVREQLKASPDATKRPGM